MISNTQKPENLKLFNNENLKTLFDLFFSPSEIKELKDWYSNIIETDCDYVVFMVRRCYLLALLLEKLTGKCMSENGHIKYITDSAVFLQTKSILKYYHAFGRMPRILIVDDLLIHGRSINHVVCALEDSLIKEQQISYNKPIEQEEDFRYCVHRDLYRAIDINVFEMADHQSVIEFDLKDKVHYFKKASTKNWRNFSNHVSSLVLASGMPNAAYIYTLEISKRQFDQLPLQDFIHTNYQNTDEYTKINIFHTKKGVAAIGTIRIIKHKFSNKYRIIPFVFMPSISNKEIDSLLLFLTQRLPFLEKYNEEIDDWRKKFGRRTYNEYISLLLSSILLNNFNTQYKIKEIQSPFETIKLARNYYGDCKDFDFYCSLISDTVNRANISLFDLEKMLNNRIGYNGKTSMGIIQYNNIDRPIIDGDIETIKVFMEDLFYRLGIREETQALHLKNDIYTSSPQKHARNLFRSYDIIYFIQSESKRYDSTALEMITALLLQFMDAGIIAVSSYPSVDMKLEGFMQFAKAGEQSLLIRPLRNYKYLSLLELIEDNANINNCSTEEELHKYFSSKLCLVPIKDRDELLHFSSYLSKSNQKAKDWDIDLFTKISFSNERSFIDNITTLIQDRKFIMENYEFYCKT